MNKTAKTLTRTAAASLLALTAFAATSLPAQAATSDAGRNVGQVAAANDATLLSGLFSGGFLNGGLINGPLVDGPLVDLGNVGPFQFGQFQ